MKITSSMLSRVHDYLAVRRALGFDLEIAGSQLLSFAQFADRSGHCGPLTIDLAVRWARATEHGTPITWARRIELLRPFAKYCSQFDAATEIPPCKLFGPAHRRLQPHIYTEKEIISLLEAAGRLSPVNGLRPLTYQTFFGLVASTGLRISEARKLSCEHIDLDHGLLTICETKFRKSRLIPIHCTTADALRRYAEMRNRKLGGIRTGTFFVTDAGKPLSQRTVEHTFARLRSNLGWASRGSHPAPRIHDLRHSFVCQVLMRFYQETSSFEQQIHVLSTYVGHAKVTDTYWYITGISELMAIASRRFEHFAQGGSQ